jgi:hypothetical protein
MLSQLKNFDADRTNEIDELVALVAFGEGQRAQYEKLNLDEPDYLNRQLRAVKRAINAKRENSLEMELKQLEIQLENSKSPAEKKIAAQKRIAEIKKILPAA